MSVRISITTSVLIACLAMAASACAERAPDNVAANEAVSGQRAEQAQSRWVRVGTGGCTGNDIGRSDGAEPQAAMCNRPWLTAVCWDHQTYSNLNDGQPWCTYKTTPASQCTDEAPRGIVYTCEPGAQQPAT
jgi:hypothetical protein